MSPQAQFNAFAQSVYLQIKNRYFDDLTSVDGIVYLNEVADWANMFLDELETEQDAMGQPVDWLWNRQLNYSLGTATLNASSLPTPTAILNLIAAPNRYEIG